MCMCVLEVRSQWCVCRVGLSVVYVLGVRSQWHVCRVRFLVVCVWGKLLGVCVCVCVCDERVSVMCVQVPAEA